MRIRKVKDYESITPSQAARDLEALDRIRIELVKPLVLELETAIAGYRDMTPPNKFLAIMRLNEEHAPHGFSLPLDFGEVPGLVLCAGCVFSGDAGESLYDYRIEGDADDDGNRYEGVTVYSEKFSWPRVELFGSSRINSKLYNLPSQWLDECLEEHRTEYQELPPAFKIGVVAQLVSQCVLTTYPEACWFAAGWNEAIVPRRWLAAPLQSKRFGPRGWLLSVRDLAPENGMMLRCAGKLRAASPVAPDLLTRGFLPYYEDLSGIQNLERDRMDQDEHEARSARSRKDRTDILVHFIDVYLPSIGLCVGRKTELPEGGKRISWLKAQIIFNEKHPEYYYGDTKTFTNSYRQAKRVREGRH